MAYETLHVRREADGKIQILTLSRPEALNALNAQLLKDLDQVLNVLQEDEGLRVLVLTGEGTKAFVAGADIKEMEKHTEAQAFQMAEKGQRLLDRLQNFKCPVIAAVNGFALGGGLELALACDFIIASDNAKMGLPEVGLGLIPGYGGTQRLARSVGKAWARRLTLTGEMISAQQAQSIGLVTEVVAPEELMKTALKTAEMISAKAPKALQWARQAINEGFEVTQAQGLKLEAELFAKTFATRDHNEGIQAFLEKRKPQFQGH